MKKLSAEVKDPETTFRIRRDDNNINSNIFDDFCRRQNL
jgi:hypothetical protein